MIDDFADTYFCLQIEKPISWEPVEILKQNFASLSYLTNISICCNFGQIQRWVGVMLNSPQVKGKKEGATKALKGGGGMMILKE